MRVLLDTHVLLWTLFEPEKLESATHDLIDDPRNEIIFSPASIWEIAIKAGLGRTAFRASPRQILKQAIAANFREVTIESETVLRVAELPNHHADPFDRLLIAQAIAIDAALCTRDRVIRLYGDLVTFV